MSRAAPAFIRSLFRSRTVAALDSGASSARGPKATNEDAYWTSDSHRVAVVADGMGGGHEGEKASAMVVEAVRSGFESKRRMPPRKRLLESLKAAHAAIRSYAGARGYGNMFDATAVALVLSGEDLLCAKAGDSRAYRCRPDDGTWHTTDDRVSPTSNRVTRFVGFPKGPPEIVQRFDAVAGETYVLCTDGLHDVVRKDEIAEIALGDGTPEQRASTLVDRALESGTRDNVTVVVADVTTAEVPSVASRLASGAGARWSSMGRLARSSVVLAAALVGFAVPWGSGGIREITIHTADSALVSIGGDVAQAPDTARVARVFIPFVERELEITVHPDEASEPYVVSVPVRRGESSLGIGVAVPPTTSMLALDVTPGATRVEYRTAGRAEWRDAEAGIELRPGEYEFRLTAAGHIDSLIGPLQAIAGEPLVIRTELNREYYRSIRLWKPAEEASPEDLRIVLNGHLVCDASGVPKGIIPCASLTQIGGGRQVVFELQDRYGETRWHYSLWVPASAGGEIVVGAGDWVEGEQAR